MPVTLSLSWCPSWFRPFFLPAFLCTGVFLCHEQAGAVPVSRIEVEGVQRMDPEMVQSACGDVTGRELSETDLGEVVRTLFKTGLFSDVHVQARNHVLVVRVTENALVNQVAFEGNRKITDDILKTEVNIKPRDVYTLARTQQAAQRIAELYRVRKGMYSATVVPKIIRLPENRVDLVFEIREGPVTRVRKIVFQGAKAFGASTLKGALYTQESHWWRFFASDDTFDPQRLSADKDALRRFYVNRGYADVQIRSAFAELASDHGAFTITFVLDEGPRYRLAGVDVVPAAGPSAARDVPVGPLQKEVTLKAGQWYNAEKVEDQGQVLTDWLSQKGFPFLEARPRVEKEAPEKPGSPPRIRLVYDIQEGQKTWVERVEILNNVRTVDYVIRRELPISDGDALNASKMARARKNVLDLGFFNNVEVTPEPGSRSDRKIVSVRVDERSTGELGLGVGGSNIDGAMMKVFFHETNFLGKGQDLSMDAMMAKRRKELEFSWTEPWFMQRPLVFGVDLSHTRLNRQHESSFNHHRTGGRVRLGYQLSEPLSHQVYYSIYRDRLTGIDPSKAATAIIQETRSSVRSAVGHDFFYDKRDSKFDPTSGYYLTLGQDWCGLGGTIKYLRHRAGGGAYYPFHDKLTGSLKIKAGTMQGLQGQRVPVVDRFSLGGPLTLRGFAFEGIGPRDIKSKNALGGLNSFQFSAELTTPVTAGKDFNLKGHVYTDGGVVWSAYKNTAGSIYDDKMIRLSVGTGISFRVPMLGDIGLFLSRPLRKKPYDDLERFQFRIGRFF